MRKVVLIILSLIFVFTGCTWKRIECGQGDTFANGGESSIVIENPTEYPDNLMELTGYFYNSKSGTPLIIVDNSPIAMSNHSNDKDIFEEFSDGAVIKIWCDNIMESYPGQTNVYYAEAIEGGKLEKISEDVIKSLQEMGWLEPETTTEYEICLPEPEKVTLIGRFLVAGNDNFIIVDDEPICVYPHPDMVEDVAVLVGFTDGDMISIECELWEEAGLKSAKVWSSRLIEDGSIEDISDEAFKLIKKSFVACNLFLVYNKA